MHQNDLARRFAALHVKGNPLALYNAWDVGSAKAIARAGAPAVATSSWAVAAAQGYDDGESMPLSLVEQLAKRIVDAVDVPVTVDFEGAYSEDPRVCAANVGRLLDVGVVGINFEDRIVSGTGLYSIQAQCDRIAAIRAMADARGVALFINARTDLFFNPQLAPTDGMPEARARAEAYAKAGASGLFVPGLVDLQAIAALCADVALPVNVMLGAGLPDLHTLAEAGVARVSQGPHAYLAAMEAVRVAAQDFQAQSAPVA
ncbi:isocitrate lyase/PEP mutase family protein [Tahibacter amnicola]|uniref:Isocitrate lyase/phosphoenolpyruvate mutase family protein n=1 Tax=Tahibacter amnicola TaxID=2976241 RepID=A0ABY6B8L0_9GAMM|nr:isocitrate lyase/phosphoenolpyruvate mutase family protein [Tahibacter amnicola]UXI65902.1 isocitrate lyase/phosphoenolpyruvate mutase family protein [Tahibacter amnicola]